MGHLISRTRAIDDLHFRTGPIGPTTVERFVVIEGHVAAKLKNGDIWTNWSLLGGQSALLPGDWREQPALLRCLRGLGLITTSDMKEHLAQCQRATKRRDLGYDQDSYDRLAKKYGLPPAKLTEPKPGRDGKEQHGREESKD